MSTDSLKFPSRWNNKMLGSLAELKRGLTYNRKSLVDDSGHPYINMKSFKKDGGFNLSGLKYFFGSYSEDDIVTKDDVLVVNTDVTDGDIIGLPIILPEFLWNKVVLSSHHVTTLRFDQTEIIPAYLYYLLSLPHYRLEMRRYARGTTVLMLDISGVKKIELFYPDKNEQEIITKILATVDRAIEQTETLIAKYQRINTGLMQDLLTRGIDENGQLRHPSTHKFKPSPLGMIPEEWDVQKLSDVLEIHHGYAFLGEYFSDEDNGIILLTPGNFHIQGGLYFTEENTKYYKGSIPDKCILKNGDILVVMTDLTQNMAILGNTVILDNTNTVLHNQRIGRVVPLIPSKINSEYIPLAMNSVFTKRIVKQTASGTTVKHTSPTKIRTAIVPLPKKSEQEEIAKLLLIAEQNNKYHLRYLKKLQKIKIGLMQDLLTGKISIAPLLEKIGGKNAEQN